MIHYFGLNFSNNVPYILNMIKFQMMMNMKVNSLSFLVKLELNVIC